MSNIPLPSGIDAAQRRFREIQSAIDTTGTRTLEAATISQGNLRVRHGGNIVIGDGGTLNISGGNLKLGKGIIEGAALKEQMEATPINAPTSQDSTAVSKSWKTIRSVSIPVPAWPDKVLLIITGTARINYSSYEMATGAARLLINGTPYGEAGMNFSYEASDHNNQALTYAMPVAAQINLAGVTALKIELQNHFSRSANYVRTSIMGAAIWTRTTQ
ncbi:hypothetical protein [Varibaculum cambriense]|uniref:hypothetical protein n=1 Tax=Varibaculum cambriense TaxID=184870 RepID=UPI00241C5D35|nr:hypothetical protein [Varibaculum cambriense]MBS5944871.1 hypothetical protein [Varibaculum cambriense]